LPGELWPGENAALDADLLYLMHVLRHLAFELRRATKCRTAEEKAEALAWVARDLKWTAAVYYQAFGEGFETLAGAMDNRKMGRSVCGDEGPDTREIIR
jgi:hypothetical protein